MEIFQMFTGLFLCGLMIYAAVKMGRKDYLHKEK
jgi:hypothetical protein